MLFRSGLGWAVGSTVRGRKLLWHNGAVPGFHTFTAIEPQSKVGAVFFCNRSINLQEEPLRDLSWLAVELLEKLK